MSHDYYIKCKCGKTSNDFNHGQEMLIEAIENSWPLMALSKTKWEVTSYDGCYDVAEFLTQHLEHSGLSVVGEYHTDVPVEVKPKAPPGALELIQLQHALKEAKEAYAELGRALERMKGENG